MNPRTAVREAFKLAISMTLMFWLALAMNWDMPGNGALAILLVSLGTAGASFNKGVARVLGTTFGVVVGFLAVGLFGQSPLGMLVFFSIYLLVVGYIMQMTAFNYAWFVAGFVPLMVWSSSYASGDMGVSAFHYGSFRYLETTSGILIYTIVSAVIWPIRAGDQLPALGTAMWQGLHQWFVGLRSGTENSPEGDQRTRAQVAGAMAKFSATLEAANADSSEVRHQKGDWQTLRVNLRAFVDLLDLWSESLRDCQGIDLSEKLPSLDKAVIGIASRLEAIATIWKDGKWDEQTELLDATEWHDEIDHSAEFSLLQTAALQALRLQTQELERLSIALLKSARRVHGLSAENELAPRALAGDRDRRLWWDPQRLVNALFPPLCFIAAWLVWVWIDPPGGPSVPSTVGSIVLNFVLNRMNSKAMLVLILLGMLIFVAPIYFWVMPLLDTGAALLLLIFAFTFTFGWLGSKKPVLKMVPILLFVNMTGISNDQSYSFMALMIPALMLIDCFTVIAVVDSLWAPTRPEAELCAELRRFFRGCRGIINGYQADAAADGAVRRRLFDSMVKSVPAKVASFGKTKGVGLKPEELQALSDSLQLVSLRIQALELAHRRLDETDLEWRQRLNQTGEELRKLVSGVLDDLSKFRINDDRSGETETLKKISREIEAHLAEGENRKEAASPALHSLMISQRGLLSALGELRRVMRKPDWQMLSEARF